MYSRITVSFRPTVDTMYPRAQKCCPTKFCLRSPYTRARWIALLPLMYPTTSDTAYLGGIEIIMCTWSDIRWPSSIRLCFRSASCRNSSPKCCRSPRYSVLRRHLGMTITWYLHSHFVWLKACVRDCRHWPMCHSYFLESVSAGFSGAYSRHRLFVGEGS